MLRLTLCTMAAIAALLCGYLLWNSATGHTAPWGCGGSGGCGDALNDPWSHWLGIPVSAPGLALYLTIVFAGCFIGPRQSAGHQQRAWGVLAGCSALAVGGGAWFVSRQILESHYCAICLAIHALGVVIATAVWFKMLSIWRGSAADVHRIPIIRSAAAGLTGLVTLIGGQTIFPSSSIGRLLLGADSSARQVDILSGLQLEDLPTLGSRRARHRIVVLADYTCDKCLRTHRMLEQLRPMLSDDVTTVILPMPLDPRCNPALRQADPRHEHACELARLALAVWRADPNKFADMDAWLFLIDIPPEPSNARSYAVTLVGEQALSQAEDDPWVNNALGRSTDLYRRCGGGVVPKLLIGSTLLEGQPDGVDSLLSVIEREWGRQAIAKSPDHRSEGGT